MSQTELPWPRKTRELHNHHMDSTVWNDLPLRDDDIIIATYGKSGTTWTQQIIAQMVFQGDPDLEINEMSPWVELRVPPREVKLPVLAAQRHRRVLKTHLPVDALVFSPAAKYLYVGRDGRDVLFSLYNHHANASDLWYQAINDTPGRVGPPIAPADPDIRRYFRTWLESDGHPFWSAWDNVSSWWAVRDLPNVLFVHFAALKADLPAEMRRIADFLGIEVEPERWPAILEYSSFPFMKAHAAKMAPLGGRLFNGGGEVFINKGVNGRWRDVLSVQDAADYERTAVEKLGPDCAHWLATGEILSGR